NGYFKYMYDILQKRGATHINIFGGGGGAILPEEMKELMDYGITKIYSPDDVRPVGLQGMLNHQVEWAGFPRDSIGGADIKSGLREKNSGVIARLISLTENQHDLFQEIFSELNPSSLQVPVLGITGTGGSGKSSLVDEVVRRFLNDFEDKTIGIISVDPSKRKTGGDRKSTRLNS